MNSKTTPKDFFVHLGATVALYTAASALINLAFSVINYAMPDKLAGYFYAGSIVWPVSILIVLVPILYGLEWMTSRDEARMPDKKDIWIRRWRIYLTIFLTIALMGGDLIALLNTYFNGEITARFVYKALVILLVAGAIGKYYFFSISERWSHAALVRKINAWLGLVLVVAAIVSGFVIVGSPAKQRALRFDNQRVSDLSSLQWQVTYYWQRKQALPEKLTDLNDPLSSYVAPVDPKTDVPYEYAVKGPRSFELCAAFEQPAQDLEGKGAYGRGGIGIGIAYPTDMSYPYPGGQDQTWDHEAGRTCFARTIDPSLYPPIQKPAVEPAAY